MFTPFERLVAMRYLRSRRREGFISVIAWFSLLGIALGVATLIIVMAVMNGFRQELLSRILGLNGHLSVYGALNVMSDFDALADRVREVPGVVAVTPIIEGQVMATAQGIARGAVVRGARPEDIAGRAIIADNIRAGSLDDFKGDDTVLVGSRLAGRLGLMVGQSITLISPQGNATAFGTVPRLRSYRIAATFEIGMFDYDSSFVYMPLPAAQLYFRMPGAVSNLEVMVEDARRAPEIAADIAKVLDPSGRIYDWQQANASFFNVIQVQRNVLFLILTMIILVAAFNIIASLITLVADKTKDIAILRTMGATQGMIRRIFLLIGACIGAVGASTGLGLGLVLAANIETIRQWTQALTGTELFAPDLYLLSQLPARVDPTEVPAVMLMALGLSVLATLYPSSRGGSNRSSGGASP